MASTMDIANPCAICYEIPQLYGILENCGHTFCYECIANWRHPFKTSARQCSPAVRRLLRGAPSFMERNAERDGTRNPKTYPLCSKLSLHIYKAANFPKTMQAKTAIMVNCKAQRKRQVCRDLEANIIITGERYCPRFNDCQYAHLQYERIPNAGTEEFLFSDEQIERLKLERETDHVLQMQLACLHDALSLFREHPEPRQPRIMNNMYEMLDDIIGDEHSGIRLMARRLIDDFFSAYLEHAERLLKHDRHHSPPGTYTVFSRSSDREVPGQKWILRIRAHM